MPDFKIKNLSIEELIKIKAEVEATILDKRYSAYQEAVKNVIEAVKKVVEIDSFEDAIDVLYDDGGIYENHEITITLNWGDLLESLKDKHI